MVNVPTVDFDLGEDIGMLRDSVRAFAQAEIEGVERECRRRLKEPAAAGRPPPRG